MKKIVRLILTSVIACSMSLSVTAYETNKLVDVDLWNASLDQPSMGNIATDNNKKALYNQENNTLQIATNSVEVSGYMSGVIEVLYKTDLGEFIPVTVLSTSVIQSGTKYDEIDREVEFISSFEIDIPKYLTKTGVEYMEIMMKVPYTPMDVVVGEGYLDARIRINCNYVV